MTRLFLGAALLSVAILSTRSVEGDERKADEPKVRGVLPANWRQIGLTQDQVQAVYRVQAKYDAEVDKLKARIEALKAEEKAELEKLLTEDQKKKLREIRTGEKEKPSDKDKPAEKDKAKDK